MGKKLGPQNAEHRQAISRALEGNTNSKGKDRSEEHCRHLSESLKGNTNNKGKPSPLKGKKKDKPSPLKGKKKDKPSPLKGRASPLKGIPKSKKHRQKLSDALMGNTNAKGGLSRTGKPHSSRSPVVAFITTISQTKEQDDGNEKSSTS